MGTIVNIIFIRIKINITDLQLIKVFTETKCLNQENKSRKTITHVESIQSWKHKKKTFSNETNTGKKPKQPLFYAIHMYCTAYKP